MTKRTVKQDQIIINIGGTKFVVSSIAAASKIASGLKGAKAVDSVYGDPANDDADYYIEDEQHSYRTTVLIELNQRVASRRNLLGLPAPKQDQ